MSMFGRQNKRLSREDQEKLFAFRDLIYKAAWPDRPLPTRDPMRMGGDGSVSDEDQDVMDAQDEIRRLLGL